MSGLASSAAAEPPAGKVSFSVASLFPKFSPGVHDYVVRCNDAPVTVQAHAEAPWRVAIGANPYRRGTFSQSVPLVAGRDFTVRMRKDGTSQAFHYHVRCLPSSFPTYTFTRSRPVSPAYFTAARDFVGSEQQFGIIFDSHGVPLWWIHAPAWNPRVLPSGRMLWFDNTTSPGTWGIHRLDGSLVRTLELVGQGANAHDVQLLGNGSFLGGATVKRSHVDTSAYGGSSDADVNNTELQQVSSGGQLLWDWQSQDHISLAETGHRWPWAIQHGYDIEHWNSIEPDGNAVIASFRNLDAVYKINKATGNIVWKLGGTTTPKSLDVKRDPRGATLGAQHDARVLPDGSLTVFDNRTNLDNNKPRAVRFRINAGNRTATLLESITDPQITSSNCCGSARRLGNGHWLIDWGQNRPIAGYDADGRRTFRLAFESTFSYRAEPVPAGAVSAADLRGAMDAMCAAGCD